MIIDAHHHVWQLDRGYTWLDGPGLAPIRRDFRIADLLSTAGAAGPGGRWLVGAPGTGAG